MNLRSEVRQRLLQTWDVLGLIDELEAAIEAFDDAEVRAERLLELGTTAEEVLLRKDRALSCYQKAFKLKPELVIALDKARAIYREMGDLEKVARLCEIGLTLLRGGESEEGTVGRARLLAEHGLTLLDLGLRDDALNALTEAAAVLKGVPDQDGLYASVEEGLSAIEASKKSLKSEVSKLKKEATGAKGPEASRLWLRMGRILFLAGRDDAKEAVSQAIVEDPGNEQAAGLFERMHADRNNLAAVAELYEQRLSAMAPSDRPEMLRRLASVWALRWNDMDRAADCYRRALEGYYNNGVSHFEGHVAAFGLVMECAEARRDYETPISLAEQGLLARMDADEKARLAVEAGRIAWRALQDLRRARGFFEQAEQLAPWRQEPRQFSAEAQAVPTAVAPESESVRAIQIDTEGDTSARLSPDEVALGRPAEPITEPIADEAPAEAEQARAGSRAKGGSKGRAPSTQSTKAEKNVELEEDKRKKAAEEAGVLASQSDTEGVPDSEVSEVSEVSAVIPDETFDEKTQKLMTAAEQAEKQSVEKAIEAWRKVVQAAPDKRLPRRELGRLYRKAERWNALVEVLKEEAERSAGEDRVAKLWELATIYRDKLKLDLQVVNTLNQIVQLDPKSVRALDGVAMQYESMNRWVEVVGALQKKVPLIQDAKERLALHLRIAKIHQEKFSNQAEAIKAYEAALVIDPACAVALSQLKQAYEKRRDWEKLIAIALREIDAMPTGDERNAKLEEIAKLASEKIKKSAQSIDLWKRVLADNPTSLLALGELEKLYEREKQWAELAGVIEPQIAQATDAARKSQLLTKLGTLYSEKLKDGSRAGDAWQALLDIEPENRRAQDAVRKLYLEAKNWEGLERFYGRGNKWDECVRVFERQAEAEDAAGKRRLYLRIGAIYRDRLAKSDRAVRVLEKVIQLDPQDAEAAALLVPLYEEAGDLKKLVTALEIDLAHTEPGPDRKQKLRRLAELSEQSLSDVPGAFARWVALYREGEQTEEVCEHLERLVEGAQGYPVLAEIYGETLEQASPALRLRMLAVLAFAYEFHLGEVDRAIEANQAVLAEAPEHEPSLDALERLFIATERSADLLAIYETRLTQTDDPAKRNEILRKTARLYEADVAGGGQAKAMSVYESILAEQPNDVATLEALGQLYREAGDWNQFAKTLERYIEALGGSGSAEAVDALFTLGQVRERALSDIAGAISCYKEVLISTPEHAGTLEALERHLENSDHGLTAAALLEPIYEEAGQHAKLVHLHEIQLGHETNSRRRVALLLKIGDLCATKLADADRAFSAYARCFTEDPSTAAARQALEKLTEVRESWPELVELYAQAAQRSDLEPDLTQMLRMQAATMYDKRLEDTDRALTLYQAAAEGGDALALDALERLYTRLERWPELLDVYRRKAALLGNDSDSIDAREALRFQMAYVQEEMLSLHEDAVGTYREILGERMSVKALRALDRLYHSLGRSSDLADNLASQLEQTQDASEEIALRLRLADLRERELGEGSVAIDLYRSVLERDPGNDQALTALERLFASPDLEHQAAVILAPIWRASGDWRKLVAAKEVLAKHSLDPAQRVTLLLEVGELYELAGDAADQAFETYGRVLKLDSENAEAQARLERLARTLDRWQETADLYRGFAESSPSPEQQVALYLRVGRIEEEHLGRDDRAAESFERALDCDPQSLAAISALEPLYVRKEEPANLVRTLLRKADIISDAHEKKALYFRSAEIYEQMLEDPERAQQIYQQVLTQDARDFRALSALERIYTNLVRWGDLQEVITRRLELSETREERRLALLRLGELHEVQLSDPDRAIDTYQGLLDLDPGDLQALSALERLFEQQGRSSDLLAVLERRREHSRGTSELVDVHFRMGALLETALDNVPQAVESYRQALALDGGHRPSLEALDRLAHGDKDPVAAALVLETLYESEGEWEKLVDLIEIQVRHASDPMAKKALLVRLSELEERRLGRPQGAFEALGRALAEDPADSDKAASVIKGLERLAIQTGNWQELAALYERLADRTLDANLQIDLFGRMGRVLEEELGDVDRAISTYRKILDIEPSHEQALLALDRLYERSSQWNELADILRRQMQLRAEDTPARLSLMFRLGQVSEQGLSDAASAVECYREILAVDPQHRASRSALELLFTEGVQVAEAAQVLEPLYRSEEAYEPLVRLQERLYERTEDPSERLALVERAAELCEKSLGDGQRAFLWWARLYRTENLTDQASEQCHQELERLARILGAWEILADLYIDVASQSSDPARRLHALSSAGRICENELEDRSRAQEVYLQVLDMEPKHKDALEALDRIYERSGDHDALAAILRRRIEITDDPDQVADLSFRLATLCLSSLDADEEAITVLRAVLDRDSRNGRALDMLEGAYFRNQRWSDLYDVYEKMVDIAPDDQRMADCFSRMAKIASDALSDPERAMDLWSRVLDIRKSDQLALLGLADLYERAERWTDLVEVLDRATQTAATQAEQMAAWKQLGRVRAERLSNDHDAIEAWLKVIEFDREDVEALKALSRLYRNTQAWNELSSTLRTLVGLAPIKNFSEEDERQLYAELGEVEGEMLLRPEEAISAWRRVLSIDPSDFRALSSLERLLSQEARWEECVQVLERKAMLLDSPVEQVDVLLQAARIWADKLSRTSEAAQVYERVLSVDPANLTASLELEQIYTKQEQWERLIELLLRRTEHTEERDGRIETLQSAARVYEKHLHQPDAAFVALQAAFREDYSNDSTAKELERLASHTGKWNELLSEYTQFVQTIPDPKTAADLWVKIGGWYGSELGHLDYAIASHQQALALEPNHGDALAALAACYRKTSRWPELVAVLGRHVEVEEDGDRKMDILVALGDVWENQMGNADQAAAAYEQAIDINIGCVEALNALERLYRRTERWDALIDILGKKVLAVEETEEVLRLKHQIAGLWEERVGDVPRAVEMYRDVLTVDPQNLPALRRLERLYEQTGQMEAYLDVLEQQLDVSGTDSERISLYERMATAWEEQFSKPERAWDCYEKILLIDDKRTTAYHALERIYRQESRWEELVETYRKHIHSGAEGVDKIALFEEMGRIYETEIENAEKAIDAYLEILEVNDRHRGALSSLARLYEQTEQWEQGLERLGQLSRLSTTPSERVEIFSHMGNLYDRLGDEPRAEQNFMEALALDQSHVPTMLALTQMYDRREEWLKSATLRGKAEAYVPNPLDKVKLLHEAGRIYLDRLDNEARAAENFTRALAIDPEHVPSAQPLSEILFKQKQWQALEPVVDLLARKVERKDVRELNQLYYRVAKTSDELGNTDKALKFYKMAYELDATSLPTLLGRAALHYKLSDWEQAFKLYQTLLVHHRDTQKPGEQVEIYYRLGQIKIKQGERKKALNMFEKALEINAHHQETLSALVDLHREQGDWEAMLHAKRSMLANAPGDDQVRLLGEIGDTYRKELANPQKAILAYQEALDLRPSDPALAHKLLELFTETKQWKKAVDIMLKVIDGENEPKRKSKYFYTAAVIYRDELKTLDEAVEFFNRALDHDPDMLKAFEAIDRICTTKRDFMLQERNYRKMIKRVTGLPDAPERKRTLTALWHALGEIYRSRLRDYPKAAASYEVAAGLEPENAARNEILAELYQLIGGDALGKAAEQQQRLIRANPTRFEAYHSLRKTYMEMHRYDAAWCVCSALRFLNQATPEEIQFYDRYAPKGFPRAKQRLTEDLWQRSILHPDQDRYVGSIMGAVWQAVALAKGAPHKNFGLKRKDKIDVASNQLLFAKVLYYANQVLAVQQPEIFLRPEQPVGMQLVNAQEKGQLIPSFVVGSELLQGRPEKEIAFAVGRSLAFLRPEHYLRLTLQTVTELKVAFQAGLKLVQRNLPITGDTIDNYMQVMERNMNPAWLEQLAMVVSKFLQSRKDIDLNKYVSAVDLSVARVGFILCSDLKVAAEMIAREPTAVGAMSIKDKIKELVLYSISEDYFAVRQFLGLEVQV